MEEQLEIKEGNRTYCEDLDQMNEWNLSFIKSVFSSEIEREVKREIEQKLRKNKIKRMQ